MSAVDFLHVLHKRCDEWHDDPAATSGRGKWFAGAAKEYEAFLLRLNQFLPMRNACTLGVDDLVEWKFCTANRF